MRSIAVLVLLLSMPTACAREPAAGGTPPDRPVVTSASASASTSAIAVASAEPIASATPAPGPPPELAYGEMSTFRPPPDQCPPLVFDLDAGILNGIPATAPIEVWKAKVPCDANLETEVSSPHAGNFGGGVYYRAGINAYTQRDFIEALRFYSGSARPALLGAKLDEVRKRYGAPAIVGPWSAYFGRPYGCLRVQFDQQTIVNGVAVHARDCKQAQKDAS